MTVSFHGILRRRSPSQSKAVSMTTPFGMNGLESLSSMLMSSAGSPTLYPKRASFGCTMPAIAFGVRVDQRLVRVEPEPFLRIVGSVDRIGIELSGKKVREVGVPDVTGLLPDGHYLLRLGRLLAVVSSKRTAEAFSEKIAKLTPAPSQVAPRG